MVARQSKQKWIISNGAEEPVRESKRFHRARRAFPIQRHFAARNVGDITALGKKLHNLASGAR
jgi:hypothetical protein